MMTFTPQTARRFRIQLIQWYHNHNRTLPWRQIKDPYKIWVSEIMLQQTTVQTVIPYYNRWLKLFPDVEALSTASEQKVLKAWEGLGYYQRAKNLHRASKLIMKTYRGRIPDDYDDLIKLPGLGPYTAAAVLSFAFDKSYPVMDANVRRIAMRLARMRRKYGPKYDPSLQEFLTPLVPQKDTGTFNQAMMELGALVCRPRNPLCLACPVSDFCQAYHAGEQEIIPRPKKMNIQKIEAVIGVIEEKRKFLIQKRPSTGLLADLWEFPGGKRRKNENLTQALKREIKEELGADLKSATFLITVQHAYTRYQVTLHAFTCTLATEPVTSKNRHRWVRLSDLSRFPFPSGSAKIVRLLKKNHAKRGSFGP